MKNTTIELLLFIAVWCCAACLVCAGPIENSTNTAEILAQLEDDLEREDTKARFGAVRTPEGQRPSANSYETDWTKWLAAGNEGEDFSGVAEYKTIDGSWIDIYTKGGYTVEVEWAAKWKEAVGQALYYAAIEDAKPGIVLLFKGEKTEKLHYMRLMIVASKYNIKVWVIETNK